MESILLLLLAFTPSFSALMCDLRASCVAGGIFITGMAIAHNKRYKLLGVLNQVSSVYSNYVSPFLFRFVPSPGIVALSDDHADVLCNTEPISWVIRNQQSQIWKGLPVNDSFIYSGNVLTISNINGAFEGRYSCRNGSSTERCVIVQGELLCYRGGATKI